MAMCEMCGSESHLFIAEIEGTELKVCKQCGKYGKIRRSANRPKPVSKRAVHVPKKPQTKLEIVESLVEEYPKVFRKAREAMSMTQKQFAKHINLKESILHKIETGSFEPPLEMAKKLEKILGKQLVEKKEEEVEVEQKQKINKKQASMGMTIGDFIKVR